MALRMGALGDTMIRHYRSEDGILGYDDGDLLINDTTGEWSRVVRDGRGLCLEPVEPNDADRQAAAMAANIMADPETRAHFRTLLLAAFGKPKKRTGF